jgi:phosphoribosylglycinamide formyltransferase 2
LRAGVSAVILADAEQNSTPSYTGVENALANENVDIRIFGKPTTRKYRRMAVALVNEPVGADMDALRIKAKAMADMVKVN